MQLDEPVSALAAAFYHAKTKLGYYYDTDIEVVYMFPVQFSSTSTVFGGLGGNAITPAYVIVLKDRKSKMYHIYTCHRHAYSILMNTPECDKFIAEVQNRRIPSVKEALEDYNAVEGQQ